MERIQTHPETWCPIFRYKEMSMKKYDILTIFDTCVDLIVDLGDTIPEFDQKEKLVQDFGLYMGGSACIFATQCAKLGLSVAGVGVLGQDPFGNLVKDTLSKCGVSTEYLTQDSRIKTSLGISLNKGEDRSILTYDQSIQAVDASMVTDEMLASARHLHLASYYLLGNLRPHSVELLGRAKKLGLTTSLDTNWDPEEKWELPREILGLVDVFLPNDKEIKFLSGCQDLEASVAYFLAHIPVVAVKLGKEGALAAVGQKKIRIPAIPTKVADTVGAGDSFDGGFLCAYLRGYSVEQSVQLGVYCGSGNVSRFGGYDGQITAEQAWRLLEEGKDYNF